MYVAFSIENGAFWTSVRARSDRPPKFDAADTGEKIWLAGVAGTDLAGVPELARNCLCVAFSVENGVIWTSVRARSDRPPKLDAAGTGEKI